MSEAPELAEVETLVDLRNSAVISRAGEVVLARPGKVEPGLDQDVTTVSALAGEQVCSGLSLLLGQAETMRGEART